MARPVYLQQRTYLVTTNMPSSAISRQSVLQHFVTLDVNCATDPGRSMETSAQELNPLCAPIKPSKILESMASLAIGRGGTGGGGGRNPRVDSWPRHGLVERAGLAAVVLSLSSPCVVFPAGGAGAPVMTGRPSLPLPMMTVFAFVDCES
jgi:hypothetical protein